MSEGRVWSFVLPYERPPLSANRRKHWSPAHREYREVRNDTIYLAKFWQQKHDFTPTGRVDVTLFWYPGNNRRADSDNITDSLKPLLDGIVRAGVLPDDAARWVRRAAGEVVPYSHDPEQRTRPTVILEIREVGEDGGSRHRPEHVDGGRRARPPERARVDQVDRSA